VTPRRGPRAHGQSLVEFALVLPIFVLLLFGLLDMGRAVYVNNTLSQVTREAARLAAAQASWVGETTSTEPTCNTAGGPVCPADVATLKANLDVAANQMAVGLGPIPSGQIYVQCNPSTSAAPTGAWTGSTCNTRTSGSLISVRIAYTFQMITPVVGQIANNLSLSATTTMVIN
jgi:Flp pilus assembly protein TadG